MSPSSASSTRASSCSPSFVMDSQGLATRSGGASRAGRRRACPWSPVTVASAPISACSSARERKSRADAMVLPRGRLAPSPMGQLHLGHARTFLLAWLHVRSRGGELCLRMEDLDASRCRPEFASGVLRDLEWLGIDWDGPVVTQSARLDELRAAAASLHASGFAYPCVCTRADLRSALSAPQRGVDEMRYAGTCRGKNASQLAGRPFALRFRVP